MSISIEELQKEWRESVIKKLDNIELVQEGMRKDISDIKIHSTSPEMIEKMQERIRSLESFRDKFMTFFFVVQGIIAIGLALLSHFWK